MKTWFERPFEVRNLFNPAFCSVLLLRSISAFEKEVDRGMPFSLSLLVLPLCLHMETRKIILANNRSYFLKTLASYPQIQVDFAKRTKFLLPYTFEALGLAMSRDSFQVLLDSGLLKLQPKGVRTTIMGTEESKDCQKAARIIGKKFAQVQDRATIYATLGIKP